MSYTKHTATKSMDILCESITPLIRGPFHIRVWREEKDPHNYNVSDLIAEITKMSITHNDRVGVIAERILELDRVNAVEVVDITSHRGVVLYADWP